MWRDPATGLAPTGIWTSHTTVQRLGRRREEGTWGTAALSAPLLSKTRLNSPQSLLQLACRFRFYVAASSFYTRIRWIRVCGLADWAGSEQINLHVHFVGEKTLLHNAAMQFSSAVNKTQTSYAKSNSIASASVRLEPGGKNPTKKPIKTSWMNFILGQRGHTRLWHSKVTSEAPVLLLPEKKRFRKLKTTLELKQTQQTLSPHLHIPPPSHSPSNLETSFCRSPR